MLVEQDVSLSRSDSATAVFRLICECDIHIHCFQMRPFEAAQMFEIAQIELRFTGLTSNLTRRNLVPHLVRIGGNRPHISVR